MGDLSPKAEPIAWSTVAAAIVAFLIDKGVPIDDATDKLLLMILPFLLAAAWARFQVYAPDTVAKIKAAMRRGEPPPA